MGQLVYIAERVLATAVHRRSDSSVESKCKQLFWSAPTHRVKNKIFIILSHIVIVTWAIRYVERTGRLVNSCNVAVAFENKLVENNRQLKLHYHIIKDERSYELSVGRSVLPSKLTHLCIVWWHRFYIYKNWQLSLFSPI